MSGIEILERVVASAFYGRFATLRPVQEAAIEPLIKGRNVVLSSGTGSGKTEAVLAPLLSRYWRQAAKTGALTILYIAPTKALVNDLEKRLLPPLDRLGLRIGIRHGDRDDLASGHTPHVLVTTPESLEVLLFRKDIALQTVQAVVIDEVHLLYNTQRGLQLSILLQRLKKTLEHDLQLAALSATVGRLQDVRDFLFGSEKSADFLEFPSHRLIDAYVQHIVDETSFLQLIRKLIKGSSTKLLIFVNSRRECERLASLLKYEERLCPFIFTHYSSLSSEVRIETEQQFLAARTAICITTSTLELGIDIGNIDAVILWGVPGGVESFLQRIGRSNRRQNKTNVICLIPDDSQNVTIDTLRFLALIDAAKKGELPIRAPYELFGAIGQQCLSVIGADQGRFTRIADLCKLFEHRNYLTRSTIEPILAELADNNYLQRHGFKNQYGAAENLYKLIDYRMIYGNFGLSSRMLELCYGSQVLGEVPVDNLLRLRQGVLVRFAGQIWRVRKLSTECIIVEPTQEKGSIIDFTYSGKGIACDAFICNRMWEIIHNEELSFDVLSSCFKNSIEEMVISLRRVCTFESIPYNSSLTGIRYFTFAGYFINKAVALITGQRNYQVDDISLLVKSPINWQSIPIHPQGYEAIFYSLFEVSSEQSIYQNLLPLHLQRHEYIQTWLKDDTVIKILNRLVSSRVIEVNLNISN
ncbi:DEAD/DEAH box RNA helicase (plasmid) [Tolypothrix tenuis PCC 7101]|uniref:DEAD/DEAH box RNA helicase n=1 Tax=Tolypothrix tenuis PCC 7101 TaxID=231146 RepID=A0A1Z4NBL6_9CYAN|nr:DEAD/DEAH box helicase [Aulosira sp. FACHB-113]BAZ03072.1 DEAD/DEAH box RNA helicase [Tolypothrix tenuis PCC 7101]BAZ78464.1 DEAD/DEAH box RNA helicase [Aulosira laxa NIES-50]